VGECYVEGEWTQDFNRSFGPEEVRQWGDLLDMLNDFVPNGGRDEFSWIHDLFQMGGGMNLVRSMKSQGDTPLDPCIGFYPTGV
jgi:hypothetical protein